MTSITRNNSTIYVDDDNMIITGNYNEIRSPGKYSGTVIRGNYNRIYVDDCEIEGNYNNIFSNGCNIRGNYNTNHGKSNYCTGNYNNGVWANRKNDLSKPVKIDSEAILRATLEREYEIRLAEEKKRMLEKKLKDEQEEKARKEQEEAQKKLKNEPIDIQSIEREYDRKKMNGDLSNEEMLQALRADKDANDRLQATLSQLQKKYLEQREAVIKAAYKKTVESKQQKLEEQAAQDLKEAEELLKREQLEKQTEKDQQKLMMQMFMQMQQQQSGFHPQQGGHFPPQQGGGFPPQQGYYQGYPMYQQPPQQNKEAPGTPGTPGPQNK